MSRGSSDSSTSSSDTCRIFVAACTSDMYVTMKTSHLEYAAFTAEMASAQHSRSCPVNMTAVDEEWAECEPSSSMWTDPDS
eukprot:6205244-Pleurochrysis_carterae.AAC.2